MSDIQQRAEQFVRRYQAVREQIGRVIVGHDEIVHGVLTCLFVGGHCLLEGVQGLGNTPRKKRCPRAINLQFNRINSHRISCPPTSWARTWSWKVQTGNAFFEFQKGPIFTQICLADEINRATPKTQSAMLETMQEGTVTVGGKRYQLEQPFFVLATQNRSSKKGHIRCLKRSWIASCLSWFVDTARAVI